jgi:superfamily II DNA helicase RecQ
MIDSDKYSRDIRKIQKFIFLMILNEIAGGLNADRFLLPIIGKIKESIILDKSGEFPIYSFEEENFIIGNKNFKINEEKLENIIEKCKYDTPLSHSLLKIIFIDTEVNFNQQDHLYPQTKIDNYKIEDKKLLKEIKDKKHRISNISYLNQVDNGSKGDKLIHDWLNVFEEENKTKIKEKYLIPKMETYDMEKFLEFYEERKKNLIKRIKVVIKNII